MIKVGIVGMGRSGWELHAESLHAFPRYSVAAVCDRSEARLEAAKEAFDARGYTDAADLFAADELDLVVISAPSNLSSWPSLRWRLARTWWSRSLCR